MACHERKIRMLAKLRSDYPYQGQEVEVSNQDMKYPYRCARTVHVGTKISFGAAFRTRRILGQQIAVMLQDFPYEEWYIHLMVPFVDYIPLRQNLTDLEDRLIWIRNNPEKVREISLNGKKFYDKYLTFEAMSDFYYELIFRLMLCCGSSKT